MEKYYKNDTMEFIGKQDVLSLMNIAPDAGSRVCDIIAANEIYDVPKTVLLNLGIEILLLGIVYGKQIDRQRRKKGIETQGKDGEPS